MGTMCSFTRGKGSISNSMTASMGKGGVSCATFGATRVGFSNGQRQDEEETARAWQVQTRKGLGEKMRPHLVSRKLPWYKAKPRVDLAPLALMRNERRRAAGSWQREKSVGLGVRKRKETARYGARLSYQKKKFRSSARYSQEGLLFCLWRRADEATRCGRQQGANETTRGDDQSQQRQETRGKSRNLGTASPHTHTHNHNHLLSHSRSLQNTARGSPGTKHAALGRFEVACNMYLPCHTPYYEYMQHWGWSASQPCLPFAVRVTYFVLRTLHAVGAAAPSRRLRSPKPFEIVIGSLPRCTCRS